MIPSAVPTVELIPRKPLCNRKMEIPLRFRMRYHPLFLELGWNLTKETWGLLQGGSIQGTAEGRGELRELVALICYLFGIPKQKNVLIQGSLIQFVFIYQTFAVQSQISLVSIQKKNPSLWGSLSFYSTYLVEFRFGTDIFIAVSPKENHSYHIALPEGDAELYRSLDESFGLSVVPVELETKVRDFIESLPL